MKIKFKINTNKFIYLPVAALIVIGISYLSIPSFYDYEKLKPRIERQILNKLGINAKITTKIRYNILPSPRIKINNIIISNSISDNGIVISDKNEINIKLKFFNFFKKNELKIKNITIDQALFKLDYKKLESLNNFFTKKLEKREIVINNSKVIINDNNTNDIISIIDLKKIKFFYKNNLNKIIFKTNIFNTKFNGISSKNFENNTSLNFQFFFPEIGISAKNSLKKNFNKIIGKTIVSIPSGKLIFNYTINENEIIFKESKFDSNLINGTFNGQIFKDPFYFSTNINIKKFNFHKFFSNQMFNKIDYKNLFKINNKINGNFQITIDDLNSNIINNADINVELKNSLIKINKIKLHINNNGFLELKGFIEDNKINLDSILNIENTKKINSILSILKSKRVKNIYVSSDSKFDLNKYYFNFSKIIFNNKIYSEDILENINININDYLDENKFPEEFNIFKFRTLINKIIN